MGSVEYSIPILSLGGRIGNSQFVFYSSRGKALVRAFRAPSNPASSDQSAVRAFLTTTSRQWAALTDAQRQQWEDYAQLHYQQNINGRLVTMTGSHLYNKVAFFKLAQAQPLPTIAPTQPPPTPVTGIVSWTVPDENSHSFGVTHTIANVAGFKLLTRITPAVLQGRKPSERDLRYIRGVGVNSFADLPLSGGTPAMYINGRFAIANGAKYLAELTVISPDGVPSLAALATLVRSVE